MRHDFLNLEVWKRSRALVKTVYTISNVFPVEEKYGLRSQVRRASISIPSNIAEGCGRNSDAQLKHFLDISIGSLCELQTQMFLALDLEYLSDEKLEIIIKEITEVRRMAMGLRNRL